MREAMAYLTEILPALKSWRLLGPTTSLRVHPFLFWRLGVGWSIHHTTRGQVLISPQTNSPHRSPLLPSSSPLYLTALCLARCWRRR